MATTSSQRPSEALPSTSYNEGEADQLRMVNPRTMDVVTEAREHLAFKASIKLKDMSIDWSDRSKRVRNIGFCPITRGAQRSPLSDYGNTGFLSSL